MLNFSPMAHSGACLPRGLFFDDGARIEISDDGAGIDGVEIIRCYSYGVGVAAVGLLIALFGSAFFLAFRHSGGFAFFLAAAGADCDAKATHAAITNTAKNSNFFIGYIFICLLKFNLHICIIIVGGQGA